MEQNHDDDEGLTEGGHSQTQLWIGNNPDPMEAFEQSLAAWTFMNEKHGLEAAGLRPLPPNMLVVECIREWERHYRVHGEAATIKSLGPKPDPKDYPNHDRISISIHKAPTRTNPTVRSNKVAETDARSDTQPHELARDDRAVTDPMMAGPDPFGSGNLQRLDLDAAVALFSAGGASPDANLDQALARQPVTPQPAPNSDASTMFDFNAAAAFLSAQHDRPPQQEERTVAPPQEPTAPIPLRDEDRPDEAPALAKSSEPPVVQTVAQAEEQAAPEAADPVTPPKHEDDAGTGATMLSTPEAAIERLASPEEEPQRPAARTHSSRTLTLLVAALFLTVISAGALLRATREGPHAQATARTENRRAPAARQTPPPSRPPSGVSQPAAQGAEEPTCITQAVRNDPDMDSGFRRVYQFSCRVETPHPNRFFCRYPKPSRRTPATIVTGNRICDAIIQSCVRTSTRGDALFNQDCLARQPFPTPPLR